MKPKKQQSSEERREEADLNTLRARDELERGCTHCGRPWYQHYRRGKFQSCTGIEA